MCTLGSVREEVIIGYGEPKRARNWKRSIQPRGYLRAYAGFLYSAHVTECTESLKALELFYSHPESFDLIVTDYTMPVLAGDRFAQEAKKIRPDIPILLCTGDPSVMSEQELEKLGVKDILSKPYSQREIAEKIKKVLETTSW